MGNAEPIVIGANQWSSGDLVAKFPYEMIKDLVGGRNGTATLSLTAIAEDGTVYRGSDDVRVVSN